MGANTGRAALMTALIVLLISCLVPTVTSVTSCPTGQVLVNGACLNTVGITGTCTYQIQCPTGATCTNSICICPTGYTVVGYGCALTTGCVSGQVLVNGVCQYGSVGIGGSCTNQAQCLTGASCSNNVCTCPVGLSVYNGACYLSTGGCPSGQLLPNGLCQYGSVGIGGSCTNQAQCISGATCINSVCICSTGFSALSGTCVPVTIPITSTDSGVGRTRDRGCVLLTPRAPEVSGCLTGQVLVNGVCQYYGTVGIYGTCSIQAQCPSGATCISGICTCPTGYSISNGACVYSYGFGCPTGQYLSNGVCLGQYGYGTVGIGGACTYQSQCLNGASCVNSMCTCPTGYSVLNGACVFSYAATGCPAGQGLVNGVCQYGTVGIGGSCTYQAQCFNGASCANNICTCLNGVNTVTGTCVYVTGCTAGQVLVNGACLSTVGMLAACINSVQCPNGAFCTNGVCTCPTGSSIVNGACAAGTVTSSPCVGSQTMVNGICYNIVGYSGSCQVTQQCIYASSQCINNICSCAPGSTYSGTSCTSSTGTAIAATTNCASNQVPFNGACYNTAQMGLPCTVSAQCVGTASMACINSICIQSTAAANCLGTQVLINNICYNLVSAGQTCSFSQQCLGGTTCINNVCGTTATATGASVTTCTNGQVQFNGRCSSSIGNGCIDYPCISGGCSGVYPACRYIQAQANYYCCQTSAPQSNAVQSNAGQMKMFPGLNSPLQCFSNSDCASFPGFTNCVQSATFNVKVCCTTTSC